MSNAIEMKSAVVSEIAEKLEKASSVIVVDYKGLTVEQVTDLRSKMREAGVEYKVYKNTLVRRAASAIEGDVYANFNDELLVGPNAIAFGYEDPVAPARILKAFMDKNPNKITLKMGVVEGEFYDEQKIVALAEIPSREELIAKLLGSLKAPMSNFVYLLDAIAKKQEEATEA
ncbi:50S ribosomal protein L10 [Peptostreptococcus canis]|uniref:Large ribosomal subunit protein uL10 n=1 Tax=Peptostreptococcus canis TaxID=1159213 RepID=A0ABR6TM96_9FIRM|nr:50S ribosomal protein L10 [Peptostreptococcus canis]MBC2576445.1 50S ribosomal protein L10 [Peptostreptococcus canis]MBP1998420.1 large subunit ribosomal protein L10 [Peptostreptococcus canis]